MSVLQDDATADPQSIITALRAELDAAQAREAALAEVLDFINRSPSDLTRVFEMILDKAHKICGAAVGALVTYGGKLFHRGTHRCDGWQERRI
jgi:hypothetical protein